LGSFRPQFLGIYAGAIGVVIIIPLIFRQLIRFVPHQGLTRDLDAYEVGYLSGGPKRAAEVLIAELTDSGALRVDSKGRLSKADRAALVASPGVAGHGIDPKRIPDGLTTVALRRMRSDPGIVSIGDRLRAAGLAVPARRIQDRATGHRHPSAEVRRAARRVTRPWPLSLR
jgi:uncharacterized protein (TIGR04222 family)